MRKLRVRLASSLADTAVTVKIELNNVVINQNYSTTNTVGNPSIIDLDVPDTGQHQLTLTFLNDASSEGEDLNLIIGRCQLSNTNGQFVLGSYLVNDPSYNLSEGWMEALYFANESFTLNVDCDDPITWFDWNSGGDETMIETQALSISDQTLSFSTGDEIYHRISYNAVNTPMTISINPNLAAWFNYTNLEFSGIMPAGTDETYSIAITDSTGASISANLTFKQE